MTYNNFEISLVVFMPNITTNDAITYTNMCMVIIFWTIGAIHLKFTQIDRKNVCPTSSVLDTCNTNSAFCF